MKINNRENMNVLCLQAFGLEAKMFLFLIKSNLECLSKKKNSLLQEKINMLFTGLGRSILEKPVPEEYVLQTKGTVFPIRTDLDR